MIKQAYFRLIIFTLLCLLLSQVCIAQLSKTHYIPPLTSAENGNANPESQYIYISTPSENEVPFTIIPVGDSSNQIKGVVSKSNPKEIYIGTGYTQLFVQSSQTSKVTNNKGYIIEAAGVIYVSVRMSAGGGAQAGALVSKGLTALGKIFRIGSYTNQNPQDNYLNFVAVMATEDNTKVNFSNLPAGLIIKNYSGTTPVEVILNKGESYTIATNSFDNISNRDGLIGCLVTSDKDIVINCGSANGSFSNGNGRDYGIDQIVGLEKVGTEYIFVKGNGENDWENVLIVAHTNNTTININGSTTSEATINEGEYYLIEGNKYNSNGNMYVKTSQPVFAYQGVGATTSEANQGLFFVPPLSCETRGNVDNIAAIEKIGTTTFTGGVSIVSKKGATVTINNLPITNFSTIGPNNVDGNSDYVTYKVTGLSGNISVESDNELYCAYFNYNGAATSGSFYSGFPTAPEINFDAVFQTLGICIPNITLEALNIKNFDTLEWFFDDGSGFKTTGNTSGVLIPTQPGRYKLVGYVSCTNLTLESFEVPVSYCPEDIDNDGIIDNIDIDNDNDGILNCIESKGNAKINLSTINSPSIVLNNGSQITNLTSGNFVVTNNTNTTNSFTGNANGNFKSEISATTNAINNYTINFSNPINFKFGENTAILHTITEGESFIARIAPADKNITLIDIDNRLLVDTNFDGIYETGITQITGSEIHFKINPTPKGTTPFQFLANNVTGFSFVHQLTNIESASIFNGILSLTCYANDNDKDGVEDSLDFDSDNDGIPDIIENTSLNLTLSSIDTDENGLDDIFDINANLIDSDNDNVPNFYDLDSDNDGIYDMFESGSNLLDTNFDGIIDASNLNVGLNGWDDNAESSPDNGIIGYVLSDLDADTIFNFIDFDSDGDICNDTLEAGFSDENNDNYLGNSTAIVNNNGIVTNASNGYTLPNSNYHTFSEISILEQPNNVNSCVFKNSIFIINTNSVDSYQWQVSKNNGINWLDIADNENYIGSTTNKLTIKNTPFTFNKYVFRVYLEKKGNSCGKLSDEVELTIHLLPVVKNEVELVQCDDDNDGFSNFNLNEANLLISENYNNETFEFYTDSEHTNIIENPISYVNPSAINSLVFVKIINSNGCENFSKIVLKVGATQIPSDFEISHFYNCEEYPANNQDGKTVFDFSAVKQKIINSNPLFSLQNISISFFENLEDALSENNSITDISNYKNTTPWEQKIYVRIDNNDVNACLGLNHVVTLHIETLPIATPVTINRQCDFDNDGFYAFDVSDIDNLVRNNQQNITISYFDENGDELPSPLPNPYLTKSQTVKIKVTNNTTNTAGLPCFDETDLVFIVDKLPEIYPLAIISACDNEDNNDGIFEFDTSTIQQTLIGNQKNIEIHYFDALGNELSSPLPNPFISPTQTITVEIINSENQNCAITTRIDLIVNKLPEFEVTSPQILCLTTPQKPLILTPEIENLNTNLYEYSWHTINGNLISTNIECEVFDAGIYYITLTNKNGLFCSRTKEIEVKPSKIANLSIFDIEIIDDTENNTITINTYNLGVGDYEFSLDNKFYSNQDEAFFQNVTPGIHTIYIRDKNECGTIAMDVSVIGFQKFFTPNNDGINDYWKVFGVNDKFYSNAKINIFDRFGKLIHQINPQDNGWDGTLNGKPLPSSDYWYSAYLIDSKGAIRNKKGHFSLIRK